MTRREASLILGISPTSSKLKVKVNYDSYLGAFSKLCIPLEGIFSNGENEGLLVNVLF